MSRRMWALAATAWAVLVVAGSALTWVAIDRAGQQVTGAATAGETPPVVVGTIGAAPTRTSGDGQGRSTTAPPTAGATSSATGSSHHTPRPGHDTSPSKNPAPPTGTATGTQTRTWSGAAGTVTVACTARTAQLKGTSPNDGWHVEVDKPSGTDVDVSFERNEAEVKVDASCAGGVPVFRAESDTTTDSRTDSD